MKTAFSSPILNESTTNPTWELSPTDRIKIIRLPKLLELTGQSRSMAYLRLNKRSPYYDEKFPKPIRLGLKSVGWQLGDVYDYIMALKMRSA